METPKFPTQNVFFLEDPDEPGKMGIPVVVIQGEQITLTNIRKDKIGFFKKIVGSIAKQAGTKAYFAEYETPTSVVEIEPEDMPGMMSIFNGKSGQPDHSDLLEKITGFVNELMTDHSHKDPDKKPDEDVVH